MRDRQTVDGAVALQPDDFVSADPLSFNGDQRRMRPVEGRWDEDFGGFADVVGGFVADERQPVVVFAPPGDAVFARDPDEDGGADCPPPVPPDGGEAGVAIM